MTASTRQGWLEMAECPHLNVDRETAERHCALVGRMIGWRHRELAHVNVRTCQTCQDFHPSTEDDLNPVIASLVRSACRQLGDEFSDRRAWAEGHLLRLASSDPVSRDGTLDRRLVAPATCPAHRHGPSSGAHCLCLVRSHDDVVGRGQHRSGWPYAFQCLKPLHCRQGVLFDDFVEQRFCYRTGSSGYREPWIGIFHHPPHDPGLAGRRNMLKYMFQSRFWRDAEPFLLGAIVLSEHLAEYLRKELRKPIVVVKHPARAPSRTWSVDAFLGNPKRRLVQLGWYLRNTMAVHQLPPVPHFQKWRILPRSEHHDRYDRRLRDYLRSRNRRIVRDDDVHESDLVDVREYEKILGQDVVFSEMIAASANNVILDCIVANTPIILNRHPAVMEYLTPDYPLYFDHPDEVPKLLVDDRIIEAHRYLARMKQPWLRGSYFRRSVAEAVRWIATTPNSTD